MSAHVSDKHKETNEEYFASVVVARKKAAAFDLLVASINMAELQEQHAFLLDFRTNAVTLELFSEDLQTINGLLALLDSVKTLAAANYNIPTNA